MHFSQPPRLYQVHSMQLSFNEDSSLLLLVKPPGNGTNYYARNQLLSRNNTSNTQRTTPKVQAPHQGCSTAHRGSEGTNDSSSTSSCPWCWCPSRNLRPFARSILINLLGITILLWLSPSKPSMAIYLINQILCLTLTSNNTNWCAHMMSPSDQLSSSIGSPLTHLQLHQVTTVSLFQPSRVYKQATLDPINSVSPLLLPQQHLLLYKSSPHHCLLLLDVPCPDEKTLFLRFLLCLPSGRKSLRASPLALFLTLQHAYQEATGHSFAIPPCSCHCHNFIMPCGAASCSYESGLPSDTTVPTRDWTPLWHCFGSSLWCKSLILQARSCHLVPLHYK